MTKAERNIRDEITEWFRGKIEKRKSFKLPDLAKRAVKEFSQQPDFAKRFVEAMAYSTFYEVFKSEIAKKRGHVIGSFNINLEAFAKDGDDEATRSVFARWLDHPEHVGDRYIQLMECTAPDLLEAENERSARAQTELSYVELFQKLRRRLKGDDKVKDRWSPEEIQGLWERIEAAA